MQELKKILKEIDEYIRLYSDPPMRIEAEGTVKILRKCKNIIRKHMNDDWIPVEERPPEDGESVLCTDGEYVYLVEYDADLDAGFGDVDGIIAWKPLPEPYHPEKGEKHVQKQ